MPNSHAWPHKVAPILLLLLADIALSLLWRMGSAQADPLLFLNLRAPLIAAFCFWRASEAGAGRRAIAACLALCASPLITAFCEAGFLPPVQSLVCTAATIALFLFFYLLAKISQNRSMRIAIVAVAALAALLLPPPADLLPALPMRADTRPPLLVMTGLPMQWAESDDPAALIGDRGPFAPAADMLGRHYRLRFLDHIDAKALQGHKRLLLAQPRRLAPHELVALDRWVREGGGLVLLADPDLRWDSAYPLGDPRRPPRVTLIDPLLAHWSIRLDGPPPGQGRFALLWADGMKWAVMGAGHFRGPRGCTEWARGFALSCPIGAGRLLAFADADMLDPRLWLRDGHPPARATAQLSDNLRSIATALEEARTPISASTLPWRRADAGFILSLLASLAFGLFCALLIQQIPVHPIGASEEKENEGRT